MDRQRIERSLGIVALVLWVLLGIGYATGLVTPGELGPRGW